MIELSRNITFGQYINNGSTLTRMDPRTKLLCAILLIAAVSFIHSFLAFAICLLFCFLLHRISQLSLPYVLRMFKTFLPFLAFIYVIQILFHYAPNTPQTILWHWQFLSITREAILTSTITMIRVFFLYYLVSMLMFTTSLVDLTDGLEALLAPLQKIGLPVNPFIMVLVIALKFFPIFVGEIERLIKAQTARGVRFDQGNLLGRTRKIAPLLIPLFVSGFKRAQSLSIAMEARCYGSHPGWRRSKRRVLQMERFDILALICTLLTCLPAILLTLFAPL